MADDRGEMIEMTESDDEYEKALALQVSKTPSDMELFRPVLADTQKVGFFSLDRTTQTDNSEIIDLKELTQVMHTLLEDSSNMRRDINFARNVMQAEFDAKLQQKALELYQRVNEKINDIEKQHDDRVATVRRAFKQQLADALVRMHGYYMQNLDQRMAREQGKKGEAMSRLNEKLREANDTIQKQTSMMELLKQQAAEYQERERELQEKEVEMLSEINKTPSVDFAKEQELEEMKGEINVLENRVGDLEKQLENKNETVKEMVRRVENLNDQLERERIMVEQLRHEHAELEQNIEQTKRSGARDVENQKMAAEREMHDLIQKAKEQAYADARKELESHSSKENERYKQLLNEKKMVEELLLKEKQGNKNRNAEQLDLEKAKRAEMKLQSEVAKLKKEIERVHNTWEKKFAILQQSLHALKDESFVRQTLQRQAAQLHQASISYAVDAPMGIAPTTTARAAPPPPVVNKKRPLPHIKGQGGGRPNSPPDYISYTVSAPSGRATAVFSANEENDVMSDNEHDLPNDIVPLPSPPQRTLTDCGDESRPSTRSHVVVLPSMETA